MFYVRQVYYRSLYVHCYTRKAITTEYKLSIDFL